MNRIMRVFAAASRRWWLILLAFVLNFAAFSVLFSLEDQFETLSGGVPTFDTQNELTQGLILEQLVLYQGETRSAYLRFALFDFVFPLVAGIFLVLICTLLLRLNSWSFAQRSLHLGLPLFPLLSTLWDYLENVSLLSILQFGASPLLLDAAILFKRLKLLFLILNGPLVALLIVLLVANRFSRRSGDVGPAQPAD